MSTNGVGGYMRRVRQSKHEKILSYFKISFYYSRVLIIAIKSLLSAVSRLYIGFAHVIPVLDLIFN
jgi:hypothetical protein